MTETKPFSVIEYTNNQGSRIIAALDNEAYWNVLCLTQPGHIHNFKWTHAELAFDAGDAETEITTR